MGLFPVFSPHVGAVITIPEAGDWKDVDANITFGTGTMRGTGEGSGRTVATFTGDIVYSFTITTGELHMGMGFYDIAEDGTYSNANNVGSQGSMTVAFFYSGGDDSVKYGGAQVESSVTWSDGDTFKLVRVGTDIEMFKNDVSLHDFSQTSSAEMRIQLGGSNNGLEIDDIQWIT